MSSSKQRDRLKIGTFFVKKSPFQSQIVIYYTQNDQKIPGIVRNVQQVLQYRAFFLWYIVHKKLRQFWLKYKFRF